MKIDNDENIKIKNVSDEANNFIDNNRIIFLNKKIFNFKIHYFCLGNTINFYFPFTKNIFNNKYINPPFSLNKNYKFSILLILILILYFCLLYYIIIILNIKILFR